MEDEPLLPEEGVMLEAYPNPARCKPPAGAVCWDMAGARAGAFVHRTAVWPNRPVGSPRLAAEAFIYTAGPSNHTVGFFTGLAEVASRTVGTLSHTAGRFIRTAGVVNRMADPASHTAGRANRTDNSFNRTADAANRTVGRSSHTNKSFNRADKWSSRTNKSFIGSGKPSSREVFGQKHVKNGKNHPFSASDPAKWSKIDTSGYGAESREDREGSEGEKVVSRLPSTPSRSSRDLAMRVGQKILRCGLASRAEGRKTNTTMSAPNPTDAVGAGYVKDSDGSAFYAALHVRVIFIFFGLVTLLGCSKSGTVSISDVTTTNSFTIVSHAVSIPSGLTLHVQGYLDGTGYLYAGNWDTQALSGTIEWTIYHDWFETNCILHYYSTGVHTGALTIHYEFH